MKLVIIFFLVLIFIIVLEFSNKKENYANEMIITNFSQKNCKKSLQKKCAKQNKRDRFSFHPRAFDDTYTQERSGYLETNIRNALKSNFLSMQFHNDYRDVMAALNNIVPQKQQKFNIANIPLKYHKGPATPEVKKYIKDFIKSINLNICQEVGNQRDKNTGWDEPIQDPFYESGWEKYQKSLGLAPSLYKKPALKSKLMIVKIEDVQYYETEDEIKYVTRIIASKENVDDQIIIKVHIIKDIRPIHNEDIFFVSQNVAVPVYIEDVYIEGYLSTKGPQSKHMFSVDEKPLYNFDAMEKNNLTDPKSIHKILMDKYAKRTIDMELRNALLDEEGQAFHKSLPHMYDFENIKNTRTYQDDFNL